MNNHSASLLTFVGMGTVALAVLLRMFPVIVIGLLAVAVAVILWRDR